MDRLYGISLVVGGVVGAVLASLSPKSVSTEVAKGPVTVSREAAAIPMSPSPAVQRIANAEAGSFAAEYERIMALSGGVRYYLRSLLIARWVDIDPAEAAAYLKTGRHNVSFFKMWGQRDSEAALAATLKFQDDYDRQVAVAAVLEPLAQDDPERVLEILSTLPAKSASKDLIKRTFSGIAERDPEAALAAAEVFGESALDGVAAGWVRKDPEAALAWVEDGHREQLAAALSEWSKTDPGAATGYLGKQAKPTKDFDLVRDLIGEQAKLDAGAALKWIQKYGAGNGTAFVGSVIDQMKGDPVDQWRVLRENLQGYLQGQAIEELADHWQNSEFESIITQSVNFSKDEQEATRGVMAAWGRHHFREAFAHAEQIKDPDRGLDLMGAALLGADGSGDRERAWSKALELGKAHREQLGAGEFTTDEELAYAVLYGDLTPPGVLASRLSAVDPEKGARWAVEHPLEGQFHERTTKMAKNWADKEPRAASEWLSTLPPSDARDHAALGLVKAVAPFDPEGAFAWAVDIGSADSRASALEESFEVLLWSDRDAALATLEAANLTETEKIELLMKVEAPDGE